MLTRTLSENRRLILNSFSETCITLIKSLMRKLKRKVKKITKLISNVRKTFFCGIAILPVCVEIIYSIWNQKSKGNQSVIPLAPHVT